MMFPVEQPKSTIGVLSKRKYGAIEMIASHSKS
jgi:hypothetical protein